MQQVWRHQNPTGPESLNLHRCGTASPTMIPHPGLATHLSLVPAILRSAGETVEIGRAHV